MLGISGTGVLAVYRERWVVAYVRKVPTHPTSDYVFTQVICGYTTLARTRTLAKAKRLFREFVDGRDGYPDEDCIVRGRVDTTWVTLRKAPWGPDLWFIVTAYNEKLMHQLYHDRYGNIEDALRAWKVVMACAKTLGETR
jgi:hypothetical protein